MLSFVRRYLCGSSSLTVRELVSIQPQAEKILKEAETVVNDIAKKVVNDVEKAAEEAVKDITDKVVDACPDAVKDTVKTIVDAAEKTCVEALDSLEKLETVETVETVEIVETCADIMTEVAPTLKTMGALPPVFIEKMEVLSSRKFKGLPTLPKTPPATD